MFGLDLKKLTGAIVVAGLSAVVINAVGNALVVPKTQTAGTVTFAAKAPKAPKAPEVVEKVMPVSVRLASANVKAGKKLSKKCSSCHDFTGKKKVKIGPPLWDIVQGSKGGNGSFKYSSIMGSKGGNWSYEDLDAFIASPKGFMKGTKMTFSGIKDAQQRADLIAYMRSLSNAPKPLP
jgi:cytochrome c